MQFCDLRDTLNIQIKKASAAVALFIIIAALLGSCLALGFGMAWGSLRYANKEMVEGVAKYQYELADRKAELIAIKAELAQITDINNQIIQSCKGIEWKMLAAARKQNKKEKL